MPHFRSRSYLCTVHDYPLSETLWHKLADQSWFVSKVFKNEVTCTINRPSWWWCQCRLVLLKKYKNVNLYFWSDCNKSFPKMGFKTILLAAHLLNVVCSILELDRLGFFYYLNKSNQIKLAKSKLSTFIKIILV